MGSYLGYHVHHSKQPFVLSVVLSCGVARSRVQYETDIHVAVESGMFQGAWSGIRSAAKGR